ncbi:MAG: CpaF family protein [Gemmataceae bacterium]
MNSTSIAVASFAQKFQRIKADLHKKLVETIDVSVLTRWPSDRVNREVRRLAEELVHESTELLNDVDRERLIEEIMAEAFGMGPLEPLMTDPEVSDILVNGPNEVYVERNGLLEKTDLVFADSQHLMQIIQRIAARVGRRADENSPMVDARLPTGERVNAILSPLSLVGPVLSIRRFGIRLTWEDLLANDTLPVEFLDLLRACVEARLSILVSGGTGGGKTTLLNVLSGYIPAEERLVTIEDTAELMLQQPHVIQLETRPPNLEGSGQVTTRELVRNSLRMRPDRIIVGECRGQEALDMLQAMNTGHEGSMTTIHANDTRDALARLEMMVMMAGFEMPLAVIREYITCAINLVVHVSRLKGGARKVMRVTELCRSSKESGYKTKNLFEFRQTGVVEGRAVGNFHATGHVPRFLKRIRADGIELPDSLFERRILNPQ